MIYLHTEFQILGSTGSLVIVNKPETEYRFHLAAMSLRCILQNNYLHEISEKKLVVFWVLRPCNLVEIV